MKTWCDKCGAYVDDHSSVYHEDWVKAGGSGHYDLSKDCPDHPLLRANSKHDELSTEAESTSSNETSEAESTSSSETSAAATRVNALLREATCKADNEAVMSSLVGMQSELQHFL